MFLLVLLAVELPLRDRWKEVGTSGALYLLIFFFWNLDFVENTIFKFHSKQYNGDSGNTFVA